MSTELPNLVLEHTQRLSKLRGLIGLAYIQRRLVHLTTDGKAIEQDLTMGRARKAVLLELQDTQEITFDFSPTAPNDVYVTNSHEYYLLLRLAYKTLVRFERKEFLKRIFNSALLSVGRKDIFEYVIEMFARKGAQHE